MVVFFHTSNLPHIHEVTFKVARFSYGEAWTLASRVIVTQIKDTVLGGIIDKTWFCFKGLT